MVSCFHLLKELYSTSGAIELLRAIQILFPPSHLISINQAQSSPPQIVTTAQPPPKQLCPQSIAIKRVLHMQVVIAFI